MDCKIVWTEPAIEDLHSLVSHVARDFPEKAREIGYALIDHVNVLAQFPFLGPVYRCTERSDVRELLCGNNRIFYRVIETKKLVELLHVRHVARDEPVL